MFSLTHPDILKGIAGNGHGSKVLITDMNYPALTRTPASSVKVYLNLCMDCITVTDVLRVLMTSMPVEKAIALELPAGFSQEYHDDYLGLLGQDIPFEKKEKNDFYALADHMDNCLTIITGDTRRGANLLLVMGLKKK